MKLNTATP